MAVSNTITYGSFTFPFCRLSVQTVALYAADGITQEGTRYTFNVSGVVTGTSAHDFNNTLTQMKCQLSTPRLAFSVQWNDGSTTETYYSFDNTGSDIDWGPKPGELFLDKFSGGLAAIYRWSLTVTSKDCFGSGTCMAQERPTDVLAIVYEWTHAIDPNGYTTRTVTGQLVVTSDSVKSGVSADHFRYVIVKAVPQPKWFKRTAQEYHQSADGRTLSFTIVDAEQQWTLPTPMTSGSATWHVRLGGILSGQGLQVDYTLSGYFETSAAHGKSEILAAIYNLAAQRFGTVQGVLIPGDRDIRESVYGQRIDFHLSAIGYAGTLPDGTPDYNVGLNTIGAQPPGSDGQPILLNPYGQTDNLNSGIIAASPQAYDACNPPETTPTTTIPSGDVTGGDSGGSQPPTGGVTGDNRGVSALQLKNPFVEVAETVSYELDNKIKVFYPKVLSAGPVFQQTANPSLRVIQAGYFKQVAKSAADVSAPNPPIFQNRGQVLSAYVSPATPEPIGDGSYNLYTIHWRYVAETKAVVADANLTQNELAFPLDPRRPRVQGAPQTGGSLPKLPGLATIPQ